MACSAAFQRSRWWRCSHATSAGCALRWAAWRRRTTGALLPASGTAIAALNGSPWQDASSVRDVVRLLLGIARTPANDICNVLGLSPWILRKGPAGYVAVVAIAGLFAVVAAL